MDIELYHHGIKGMKWGVRRYQNEDGSWTPEGKERYGHWKGPNTYRYHRLNRKADRGDRLRAQGKTITGNWVGTYFNRIGIAMLGGYAAQRMLGQNISFRYKDTPLANLNSNTIKAGAAVLSTGLIVKTIKENSDIRTSYRRDQARKGQRWAG